MKDYKLNDTLKASPLGRLVGLLFFLIFQFSFAITDTAKVTKQQYPLNDPRNPDCPCHKLQKQAEDEFALQNNVNKEVENTIGNNANEIVKNNIISKSKVVDRAKSSDNASSNMKSGHKKNHNWITKRTFRYKQKLKKIKRQIPQYEICFKW